ncbi:class I SAM-dependent methyltransferase [Paenibacillus agricola]|uniref:Class I SAM-dependent methyltransferase n=1 Tax=Paenibacillus agricola TaxID=2716264 RepID=A0ABX0J7C2_9BACL|nr:class I SAM-dependent methyltransferase [Paenibacillus agricola]NHN31285.1 class I SAM-dependent methyltransferase [Paenibacillus agricola]
MSNQKYEQAGVAMTCRSFAEYEQMFNFELAELQDTAILDVAGGASSFVAEACARGIQARAVDPLYELDPESIYTYGLKEIETSTEKIARLESSFDWSYYGNLGNHRKSREQSLARFIDDYRNQRETGRYISALLPQLPYEAGTFSLVVCSHFLFLYHEQFDYEFHLRAVEELLRVCRVGGQVQIYPLRTLHWDLYPHLEQLIDALEQQGAKSVLLPSSLPFIPGSDQLLCITK